MDAPRFPLMRLPLACSQNVLRILTAIQLFEISLASKKTKNLVQSLKIRASEFFVYIGNRYLSIRLKFLHGVIMLPDFSNLLDFLKFAEIHYRPYSNEMDERTFLNHLKFIFNVEKIKVDFGSNSEQFNFEPILKGRQDIESVTLIADNQEENRRILNIMKPSKMQVSNLTRPTDVLIQNVDYLRVKDMIIRLEDLLVINVRNFSAACSMVPAKKLNRFLKLWMGGSNLQLESLQLDYRVDNDFKNEDIFDRLKTTRNNSVRYFKSADGTRKINGGIDIFRFDGTMATIRLYRGIYFDFEMFVWHDHCIAEDHIHS